jgi:hypothetical protein
MEINMTILATSPNGQLRLRQMKNGKGVVELLAHGEWVWCVWKSSPMERAKETFANQVRWHQ